MYPGRRRNLGLRRLIVQVKGLRYKVPDSCGGVHASSAQHLHVFYELMERKCGVQRFFPYISLLLLKNGMNERDHAISINLVYT